MFTPENVLRGKLELSCGIAIKKDRWLFYQYQAFLLAMTSLIVGDQTTGELRSYLLSFFPHFYFFIFHLGAKR